jgi:hypothetical protein
VERRDVRPRSVRQGELVKQLALGEGQDGDGVVTLVGDPQFFVLVIAVRALCSPLVPADGLVSTEGERRNHSNREDQTDTKRVQRPAHNRPPYRAKRTAGRMVALASC